VSKVLIVDDQEIIRMLLQAHLKQTGHRVVAASSAEEALAAVREKGPPDVAVLDIGLPDMQGFELAEKHQSRGRLQGPTAHLPQCQCG